MESQLSPSDAELSALVRAGNRDAFGELWRRHSDSALIVARQYRSVAEPEDIVQEASRRVLNAILGGGGPFGDFRPYMNQTVRNVAVSWSREHSADPIGDVTEYADQIVGGQLPDYADGTLERMVTVRAFKSLPKRWQMVLWYAYVEGMGSDETADHLGLSRNATASLIGRAREGLRQAWLKAHVAEQEMPSDCQQVIELLPALERNDVTARQRAKAEEHLRECESCAAIAAEVRDLAARLPVLLLPFVVAGFDVLSADLKDLLAHDPSTASAAGQGLAPQAMGADSPFPPSPTKPTTNGGFSPAHAWLLSGVVAGALGLVLVLVNFWPEHAAQRPQPDLVHLSASEPTSKPSAGAQESPVVEPPAVEASGDPSQPPTASPSTPPSARPSPGNPVVPAGPAPQPTAPGVTPEVPGVVVPPTPGGGGTDPEPPPGVVPTPVPTVNDPGDKNILWLPRDLTLSGTGEPNATVVVVLNGHEIGRAQTDAGGAWSFDLRDIDVEYNAELPLTVHQIDDRGIASASVTVGTARFTTLNVADAVSAGTMTRVQLGNVAGTQVEISVDGGAPAVYALEAGDRITLPTGLAPGSHTFRVRSVSGDNVGPWVTHTVTVI